MLYSMKQRESAMPAFGDGFWVRGITFLAVIPRMFLLKKLGPNEGPIVVE
jgi:hypothetical protein